MNKMNNLTLKWVVGNTIFDTMEDASKGDIVAYNLKSSISGHTIRVHYYKVSKRYYIIDKALVNSQVICEGVKDFKTKLSQY